MLVSHSGNLKVVKYLVEKKADINAKETNENTVLMMACGVYDNLELIKYLIENGSDINSRNIDNWTALMNASFIGQVEIVKYLIGKGADINVKNNTAKTALDIAVEENYIDIIIFIDKYINYIANTLKKLHNNIKIFNWKSTDDLKLNVLDLLSSTYYEN